MTRNRNSFVSTREQRNLLDRTTLLIKTFERPECLEALLTSIRARYPAIRIMIADDSRVPRAPRNEVGLKFFPLSFDVGLSAGRNLLLEHVDTPYFILLDDDLVFVEQTRIECLLMLLERHSLDLVAGAKRLDGKPLPFEGALELEAGSRTLYRRRGCAIEVFDDHVRFDYVHNFFAARTQRIRALGGWDDQLKLGEHTEFFLRLKLRDAKVGFTPDVVVEERRHRSNLYQRYRRRASTFKQQYFYPSYNIDRVVDVS